MSSIAEPSAARVTEQLVSTGRILGIEIVVTDHDEWEVTHSGIRVGLGYYVSRGYGPDDAVLLAFRDFWASVRVGRLSRGRTHRRQMIERKCPELAPLLIAVDRMEAEQGLLTAMPGFARGLREVVLRSIPDDLRLLPPPLQWVGLVVRCAAGGTVPEVDDPVRREYQSLVAISSGAGEMFLQALFPGRALSPVDRFDRALALLAPPYLRLIAGNTQGLSDAQNRSVEGNASDGVELGVGLGSSAEEQAQSETSEEPAGEFADAPSDSDRLNQTREETMVPPSALVEVESPSFPEMLLDTPLPTSQPGLNILPESCREASAEPEQTGGAMGLSNGSYTALLHEYRSRTERYRAEINRTREAWRRVLSEHLQSRRAMDNASTPDGEHLHLERLAATVTETKAGVTSPAAFREFRTRVRQIEGFGDTDYVLVLDRSGSMKGRAAELCADTAMVMVESLAAVNREAADLEHREGVSLGVRLRSALLVFGDEPTIVKRLAHPLNELSRASLYGAVRGAQGATVGASAMQAVAEELGLRSGNRDVSRKRNWRLSEHQRRVQPRRIVVFVSDGDLSDTAQLTEMLREFQEQKVQVHGIGIGSAPGMSIFAPNVRRIESVQQLPEALSVLLASYARSSVVRTSE